MAESSKLGGILDIALPALAFIASAYSPQGAQAAQALTGALALGQRRRAGEKEDARLEEIMKFRQGEAMANRQQAEREFEAGRPGRELQAAQTQFQHGNLQDIQGILEAPAPATGALQALGAPQTARLAEALGRGEQVPLPMEQPSTQMRQQRLQKLAMSPEGTAQLTAAGLGDVAQRTQALMPKAEDPRQFAQDKREAMRIFDGLPSGRLDSQLAKQLKQGVAGAKTQDDLTNAIAQIPIGLGAAKGSIEEQVYRELAPQMGALEALKSVSAAKREPPNPLEQDERRARIAKLQNETAKMKRDASGEMSDTDRRKLQLQIRGDIRQEPTYKDYQSTLAGYTNVAIGAKRADAQGDLAIVNGTVRLLDPGSVNRPSEVAAAMAAQGWLEWAQTWIPRVRAGEALAPEVRQRFLSMAQQIFESYSNRTTEELGKVYGSVLKGSGIPLTDVFVQPGISIAPESSGATISLDAGPGGNEQPATQAPGAPAFTIKGIREKQ